MVFGPVLLSISVVNIMSNYKLTYFNGRGRAEAIRIIFEVKGIKYEDVRIKPEDWPNLKPSKY